MTIAAKIQHAIDLMGRPNPRRAVRICVPPGRVERLKTDIERYVGPIEAIARVTAPLTGLPVFEDRKLSNEVHHAIIRADGSGIIVFCDAREEDVPNYAALQFSTPRDRFFPKRVEGRDVSDRTLN